MARLRWRIIALLAWVMLFFNIERLDIGGTDTIDIASGVYVVAILVTVAGLMPIFQRRPIMYLVVPTLLLYGIVLAIDPERQLVGGVHTYITFTSIFLLSVTIFLTYRVGQALDEFVQAVEEITFSNKGERLRTLDEANETVQIEMINSRRHQRPLSLVVLQADGSSLNMLMHRLVRDVQRSMMQRYVLVTVTRVLSKYMRRTDMIIEGKKLGRFVLLAPETTEAEAHELGQRMARMAQDKLGVQANHSSATFPEHALTFEDLLSVAEQRLRDQHTLEEPAIAPEEAVTNRAEQSLHELTVGQLPVETHAPHTGNGVAKR